jgi:hypothetical protein
MPLLRGNVIGYDAGRMTFEFTMLTPGARIVDCAISSTAMDYLSGGRGTSPKGRETQFLQQRQEIEQIASDMFDRQNTNNIRIFSKHLDLASKTAKSGVKPE